MKRLLFHGVRENVVIDGWCEASRLGWVTVWHRKDANHAPWNQYTTCKYWSNTLQIQSPGRSVHWGALQAILSSLAIKAIHYL
jgi:hypothetical protein